ncbi:hypothetical protein NL676_039275 [Syzygium grande]|nr:hypothetical protein NL676_039275 [Syzygium grande]
MEAIYEMCHCVSLSVSHGQSGQDDLVGLGFSTCGKVGPGDPTDQDVGRYHGGARPMGSIHHTRLTFGPKEHKQNMHFAKQIKPAPC